MPRSKRIPKVRRARANYGGKKTLRIGRNSGLLRSNRMMERLRMVNPLDSWWLQYPHLTPSKLAIATGIKTPRLLALRTGLFAPHFWECIQLEKATKGELTLDMWRQYPRVQADVTEADALVGEPMRVWHSKRRFSRWYLQDGMRHYIWWWAKKFVEVRNAELPYEELAREPLHSPPLLREAPPSWAACTPDMVRRMAVPQPAPPPAPPMEPPESELTVLAELEDSGGELDSEDDDDED